MTTRLRPPDNEAESPGQNRGRTGYSLNVSTHVNRGRKARKLTWVWLLAFGPLCLCCGLLAVAGNSGEVGSRSAPLISAYTTPVSIVQTVVAPILNPLLPIAIVTVTPTPHTDPVVPLPSPTFTPNAPAPIATPIEGGLWPMVVGDATHSGFVHEGLGGLHPSPRWYRNPQANGTGLVVAGGLVVFGSDNGAIRAQNWTNGITAWETPLGANFTGSPAIFYTTGAALVIAPTDYGLFALHLRDGSLLWHLPPEALLGATTGVTVGDDSALYAATDTGWLHALDPFTGSFIYSLDFSATDSYYTPPALSSNLILLLSADQHVRAIARDSLETVWATETLGAPYLFTIAEGGGLAFVGVQGGNIQAIWLDGGATAWIAQASAELAGLANDGIRLFATVADGNVYALDAATGYTAWVVNTGSGISAAPLTDGYHVLIGTHSGEILYFQTETGIESPALRVSLNDPIWFAPAPAGNWLFVRATQIYGLGF